MKRTTFWILLILLAAAFLRLYALADAPPGMTHDEADHGLDAWGVVNGIRPLYFTVGYGREPLFDYATAALMSFMGPTFLAGRLTAAFFSLLLVAGVYAWGATAFERRVGLLAAAGLALSFWGMMTGRHALRSVTMPALFTLAAVAYWKGWRGSKGSLFAPNVILAGVLLGATFYSYMPARLMWALFPGLLLFWLLFGPRQDKRRFGVTMEVLALAAIIAFPLFYHLQTNPGAEVRLTQLTGPLRAALSGDFGPLWGNTLASLRSFTIEGDGLWRYNLPGKPFLGPVMGALFYGGVLYSLAQAIRGLRLPDRQPHAEAHLFSLAWLFLGMIPAFITGPEASVTRAIGMQPVLYLFPALALVAAWDWVRARWRASLPAGSHKFGPALAVLLFAGVGANTATAYFGEWANHPEVRVQYESTLVAAIEYLNQEGSGAVALSNPTPDTFHSPSTALMTLRNPDVELRWFNGQASLLLPGQDTATLIFPGFAELTPALSRYFLPDMPSQVLPLRPTDIDRPLTVYEVDGEDQRAQWGRQFQPVEAGNFSDAVWLLGYDLQTPILAPGETLRLATRWRAMRPEPDLVLFTHLVREPGQPPLTPETQADRLDAPSIHWIGGDEFIQLHEFTLPEGVAPGEYRLVVGVYRGDSLVRLPRLDGRMLAGDMLPLPQPVTILPSQETSAP